MEVLTLTAPLERSDKLQSFLSFTWWSADLKTEKTKSGEELKEIIEDCLMAVHTYTEICDQEDMVAPPPEKKPQHLEVKGITVSKCEQFLLRSLGEIRAGTADQTAAFCWYFQSEKLHFFFFIVGNEWKKMRGAVKFVQRRSEMEFPHRKQVLDGLDRSTGEGLLHCGASDEEDHQNQQDLVEQWWGKNSLL